MVRLGQSKDAVRYSDTKYPNRETTIVELKDLSPKKVFRVTNEGNKIFSSSPMDITKLQRLIKEGRYKIIQK